jgi:hypothetical protein
VQQFLRRHPAPMLEVVEALVIDGLDVFLARITSINIVSHITIITFGEIMDAF